MLNKKSNLFKLILVNIITFTRFLGAIILPFIYIYFGIKACADTTIILFFTDCIDGFLARKLKVSTFFGSALDAISDKLLNTISFILLSIEYNVMLLPLILEIAILYTSYVTYRYGGNVKSSFIGKIKTIVLDICVILSFLLISIRNLSNQSFFSYINNNISSIISLLATAIIIFCLITLIDYNKKYKMTRKTKNTIIIYEKRKKKTFKEIMKDALSTEYYLKHKNESIMKQLYY